ncbi:MAG TPA: hypothetical protein VGS05_02470 [Candidatus Sulfotelmatobacter sp.]|nr:hypothetical protein [Candidatus Sulfotelmatobacter sp.]
MGRLFYWGLVIVAACGFGLAAYGQGPSMTTVADTVYMADGTFAQGSLIISWPAFVTAGGSAVAAGTTSVTLGANGALSVALVPNAGATPAGVYYSVIYQLGPGQVKSESWVVPATSPANLAAVRIAPGSGLAGQPVSMQYVDSELATKADDSAVVHLSGTETISGSKSFSSAPTVPDPTSAGQVATKGYVDSSVSNVGAGNYLATTGGTMSGPITLPGNSNYCTQLVESLSDGGECSIASSTTLDFYPQYVPALGTLIVASYRGVGRAVAEVANSAGIAALQNGGDDGVRGMVRTIKIPSARTQADCENAALAILDDAAGEAWTGSYQTWSDFLPSGAGDIFPGDALTVDAPSQNAAFSAIVRKVVVEVADPADDRGMYTIEFANELAEPLALQEGTTATTVPLQDVPARLWTTQVGSYYLTNLTNAQITQVSSTTVQVDAGTAPASGGGIEVRAHDYGWGASNDRNLLGRFSTQTFSLPRLARTQNYFLRLHDSSSPPRYSRYAAALHVDYPL